jgi:hypothetical protein
VFSYKKKKVNLPKTIPLTENRSIIQPKWKAPAKLYYTVNWNSSLKTGTETLAFFHASSFYKELGLQKKNVLL